MNHKSYQMFFEENGVKTVIIDAHNLDEVINLQKEIMAEQQDQTLYRYTSKDAYLDILNTGALIIGLFIGSKLIAFGALMYPNTYDLELLDFKDVKDIDKNHIFYYRAVAVKKEYRGNKLQRFFIEHFEGVAKENGGTHMILNVHHDNMFSVQNFENSGYVMYGQKVLDDIYNRDLYYKKI